MIGWVEVTGSFILANGSLYVVREWVSRATSTFLGDSGSLDVTRGQLAGPHDLFLELTGRLMWVYLLVFCNN